MLSAFENAKLIARNKHEVDEETLKRLKKEHKMRKALQAQINPPEKTYQPGGIMGKLSHLIDLKPEGVVGELIATLGFNLIEALFNFQFQIQDRLYKKAQTIEQNQNIKLAYQPNVAGFYPSIYPLGPDNEPNYEEKPYSQEFLNADLVATAAIVERNGYVFPANYAVARAKQWALFKADMNGDGALSQEELNLLNKTYESVRGEERNLGLDSQVVNRPTPTPKPAPGKP